MACRAHRDNLAIVDSSLDHISRDLFVGAYSALGSSTGSLESREQGKSPGQPPAAVGGTLLSAPTSLSLRTREGWDVWGKDNCPQDPAAFPEEMFWGNPNPFTHHNLRFLNMARVTGT